MFNKPPDTCQVFPLQLHDLKPVPLRHAPPHARLSQATIYPSPARPTKARCWRAARGQIATVFSKQRIARPIDAYRADDISIAVDLLDRLQADRARHARQKHQRRGKIRRTHRRRAHPFQRIGDPLKRVAHGLSPFRLVQPRLPNRRRGPRRPLPRHPRTRCPRPASAPRAASPRA